MQLHLVKSRLVNSYIIEEHGALAVVDVSRVGAGHVAGHIEKVLQRRLSDIKLIVCTHDDFDHIGGIYQLARVSGAEVGIPYASRSMIRKLFNDPTGIVFRPMTMIREIFRPRMWSMYASPRRNRKAREHPHVEIGSRDAITPRQTEPDFLLKHEKQERLDVVICKILILLELTLVMSTLILLDLWIQALTQRR